VLSPGQQLIIPKQTAVAGAAPSLAPATSKPVAAAAAPSSVHIVQSRRYADEHRAPQQRPGWRTRQGQQSRSNRQAQPRHEAHRARFEIRGRCSARAARYRRRRPRPTGSAVAAPATKMASAGGPPQAARLASATTNVVEEKPVVEQASVKPSEATGALPTFRWPVRGKVITTYGSKTNGKSNDGINLAVPEGTPVKAAEDGVVAYSGNELKGYGNLVLVRHSNGYVTAYAHASELLVKRGDTIKRGQIIAKSGQSGEVGSPQLHFEIRKGSSPVDPLQFLNGA
jgi:murein DD-endopeptidase MepM/ murein hydrolase activator NlpD